MERTRFVRGEGEGEVDKGGEDKVCDASATLWKWYTVEKFHKRNFCDFVQNQPCTCIPIRGEHFANLAKIMKISKFKPCQAFLIYGILLSWFCVFVCMHVERQAATVSHTDTGIDVLSNTQVFINT